MASNNGPLQNTATRSLITVPALLNDDDDTQQPATAQQVTAQSTNGNDLSTQNAIMTETTS